MNFSLSAEGEKTNPTAGPLGRAGKTTQWRSGTGAVRVDERFAEFWLSKNCWPTLRTPCGEERLARTADTELICIASGGEGADFGSCFVMNHLGVEKKLGRSVTGKMKR